MSFQQQVPGQQPGQYPPGQYPPDAAPPSAHGSSSPVSYGPKIVEAIGQVDLLHGEQVVYAIQADGFFLGSNPLLKMMAAIQAFFTMITGGHIRVFLVVTNQRVIVVKSIQFMCGMTRMKSIHSVALAGIKEAGSSKDTQLCCIHTRLVSVQSMTQTFQLVVKKMSDQEIRSFVTNLSAVIVAHSNRASV